MTRVSIHQPNFLPWLGYFQKLHQSDVHIFLDDVVTARGTWVNRVKVMCDGRPIWLTVPLDRSQGSLIEVHKLKTLDGWTATVLNRLSEYYRRATHFREVMDFLSAVLGECDESLCRSNQEINKRLLIEMGVSPPHFLNSSTLGVSSRSSQRLVDLVTYVGGSVYISGTGADGYMNLNVFDRQDLKVEYVKTTERNYSQLRTSEFYPGCSIVDALFNLGFDEVGRRVVGED